MSTIEVMLIGCPISLSKMVLTCSCKAISGSAPLDSPPNPLIGTPAGLISE